MDWATIQEGIRTAVGVALGLEDDGSYKPVVWERYKHSGTFGRPNAARVRLRLNSPRGQGQDEIQWNYNEDTDALEAVTVGPRTFWVSCRIELENQAPGTEPVGALASRLRSRIRWPRIAKPLAAAGVAVATIRETVDASYVADGRDVGVAIVDLVCQAAENDTDQSVAAGGYFTKVQVSGAPDTDLEDIAEREIGPP